MNAIIVDDEEYARQALFFLIKQQCPQVTVKGIARSVAEARKILKSEKIDLVFLDISMPLEDGFSLFPDLEKNTTSVIITTAYNQHAVKAIRASAVDYLLKPIDKDELHTAIKKADEWRTLRSMSAAQFNNHAMVYNSLHENMNEIKAIRKINLPHTHGFHVVDVSSIMYILADSNYSTFHTEPGDKIVVSKHLKEYESILEDCDFCRIHKSRIINLRHMISYSNKNGLVVKMSDGSEHTVSRRKSPKFMETARRIFRK
ncbi:LytTR family DNA-binding domain-containing protein [Daejeonella sp. JGW-45]|uniref:LytR/AlgR family response regulator transcription factor n=1 Tax=Daejeonella sp. JGW-45 TaxID=3034148 RepID=UPI0023ECAE06|nr:LytTR family DNA-binding domain-containing protein [Daejeonella sp. JGW-45]